MGQNIALIMNQAICLLLSTFVLYGRSTALMEKLNVLSPNNFLLGRSDRYGF